MNYYNEFEPQAAAWLRELIAEGLIPAGVVDTRSIEDVHPSDLAGFTQCHFFAGIGGWPYALALAGWPADRPVWTGSCPCQPFSKAGKGAGFDDQRHLWPAWFHLIRQCRPPTVFGEQVATAIKHGWLDTVACDMEGAGYALASAVLRGASVGAPHDRRRLFFVANTLSQGVARPLVSIASGLPGSWGWRGEADLRVISEDPFKPGDRWPEPLFRSLDDGLPARVGRLRGYGNAIVPQAAAEFIRAAEESRVMRDAA